MNQSTEIMGKHAKKTNSQRTDKILLENSKTKTGDSKTNYSKHFTAQLAQEQTRTTQTIYGYWQETATIMEKHSLSWSAMDKHKQRNWKNDCTAVLCRLFTIDKQINEGSQQRITAKPQRQDWKTQVNRQQRNRMKANATNQRDRKLQQQQESTTANARTNIQHRDSLLVDGQSFNTTTYYKRPRRLRKLQQCFSSIQLLHRQTYRA